MENLKTLVNHLPREGEYLSGVEVGNTIGPLEEEGRRGLGRDEILSGNY